MICYQSFWEISADDYVNTKYQRCLTLLLMDNPQKVKYLSTSKLTKSMEIWKKKLQEYWPKNTKIT